MNRTDTHAATTLKRVRLTVRRWDERFVYGVDADRPDGRETGAEYATGPDSPFAGLRDQLYEGAQINLLACTRSNDPARLLKPEMVILEPDFLIDITALCGCVTPYGHSPYTYLMKKFAPPARSAAIQLGNAANQFLDDCVNAPSSSASEDALYLQSMRRSFQSSPLTYSTLTDIDRQFFDQCRKQFSHIRQTVQGKFGDAGIDILSADAQLEPSFLCEALGLQGRMDLLACDGHKLVELKSGKANEYPSRKPKEEHYLQMALYKEILHYNLDIPYDEIGSYLFYSRYPVVYDIDVPRTEIRRVMALRNAIVHLEHRLASGETRQVVAELDEAHINTNGLNDRFYHTYLRPQVLETIGPLGRMEGTEADYFHRFLAFTERELFLSKVGDNPAATGDGFASTWLCTTAAKQENGNMLIGQRLRPATDEEGAVERLELLLPPLAENLLPNFRQGDIVMLYEHKDERDTAVSRQVFRCVVEEIQADRLWLKLAYKQRNATLFHPDSPYAVETSHMDGSFKQACAGLFALLTAPRERKELLLGKRPPATDPQATLNLKHENEEVARIVRQAKQAKDYFLLVGPPGTGKTSVALKAMVEEFLSDYPPKNLLLMAYTNRAVDEICQMLATVRSAAGYVRIGNEMGCAPEFRPRLMRNVIGDAASRLEVYNRLMPVRVFVGTISSLCGQTELFNLKVFDVALIDEASQVLEPQLLPLLCARTVANRGDYNLVRCAIEKFVFIGDHKQLPAVVVQSASESRVEETSLRAIGLTDCRHSLFERLHRLARLHASEGVVAMLRHQGRMHPDICEFVNREYYGGQLGPVPLPHQLETLPAPTATADPWTAFVGGSRVGFVDVAHDPAETHPKSNRREAEAVARIVDTLCRLHDGEPLAEHPGRHIGIIVPFRAQITMVRKMLAALGRSGTDEITIDTVERYQGSQRDVVVFATTIGSPALLPALSEPSLDEGHEIDRKLNVALTRARKQFFLVGGADVLRHSPSYAALLDFLGNAHTFRTSPKA